MCIDPDRRTIGDTPPRSLDLAHPIATPRMRKAFDLSTFAGLSVRVSASADGRTRRVLRRTVSIRRVGNVDRGYIWALGVRYLTGRAARAQTGALLTV
jgi:hypothetical protein